MFPETGKYLVTLEASNYCGSTFYQKEIQILDLFDDVPVHPIDLYPNPSKAWFTAKIPVTKDIILTPALYTADGKQVQEFEEIHLRKGNNEIDFQLSYLKNGLYFLIWTDGKSQIINKLIIIK